MTAASINEAAPQGANDKDPALIAKAEALLDRAHFSPGEIDGADGDDFRNAVRAFQAVNGLAATGELDADTWNALAPAGKAPVVKTYTISDSDVAGPFTKAIPATLEGMAKLPGLSYTSPLAELAEKFHMAQSLLQALNPRADFKRPRTEIMVADVPPLQLRPGRYAFQATPPKDLGGPIAATIVVDKPGRTVAPIPGRQVPRFLSGDDRQRGKAGAERRLQGKERRLESRVSLRSKVRVEEVKTKRKLTVQPGPNNPVGLVWIDLGPRRHTGFTARPRLRRSGTRNRTAAHPADELGCGRFGGDGAPRHGGEVRRSEFAGRPPPGPA